MTRRPRTLLEPGHEAEWTALGEQKRRALRPPADASVEELLRHGVALSRQAAMLLGGIDRAEDGRRLRPS
ncbi:MAG: hypothetical protein WD844_10030 [Thermoleophilaceae bacterium]